MVFPRGKRCGASGFSVMLPAGSAAQAASAGEEGSRQHPAVQAVHARSSLCWINGHGHGIPVGSGAARVTVDAFGGKPCSVVSPEGQRTRMVFGGLASG